MLERFTLGDSSGKLIGEEAPNASLVVASGNAAGRLLVPSALGRGLWGSVGPGSGLDLRQVVNVFKGI